MNRKKKTYRILTTLLVVFLLLGVIPYLLTFLGSGYPKSPKVRMLGTDGQIRTLDLEEYLLGVVAAEMPAEFELEALKAQSVAARTYVLKRIEDARAENSAYDVDTTEKTQAWNSKSQLIKKWGAMNYFKYQRKISRAVKETRGQVLTYNNEKISSVYHSSSGRFKTERAGEVWVNDLPYLQNVISGELRPQRFTKRQTFDSATFFTLLDFPNIPEQFNTGDMVLLERTAAGRVKSVAIKGKVFKGTDIRKKLQLPSTDFEWRIEDNRIEFISYGKGHGVGMSQYGANDLARTGYDYRQILEHFYPGTKLENVF